MGARQTPSQYITDILGAQELKEGIQAPVEEVTKEMKDESEDLEVLEMGDSQVKYFDQAFCERQQKRIRVCLPGAEVQEVTDRWERITAGLNKDTVAVVHVGIDGTGRSQSVELEIRYRALQEMRESGKKCVLSGVLPRVGCSDDGL